MEFDRKAKQTLEQIDFCARYRSLTDRYSYVEEEPTKLEKKAVLDFFESIVYEFKYAEQSFIYRTTAGSHAEFQLTMNIKYGRVTAYFFVKQGNEYLNLNSGNLGFINKYLVQEEEVRLPWYNSMDGFKDIAESILSLFVEFKNKMTNA